MKRDIVDINDKLYGKRVFATSVYNSRLMYELWLENRIPFKHDYYRYYCGITNDVMCIELQTLDYMYAREYVRYGEYL